MKKNYALDKFLIYQGNDVKNLIHLEKNLFDRNKISLAFSENRNSSSNTLKIGEKYHHTNEDNNVRNIYFLTFLYVLQ
jgi:hypothetical protein